MNNAIIAPTFGVMPAVSVMQPWASLLAIGKKTIETRSWATKQRGYMAIHSSARMLPECRHYYQTLGLEEILPAENMPLGSVIAIGRLVDVRPTSVPNAHICSKWVTRLSVTEYILGNFGPDRYGWFFEDVVQLPRPVVCKGSLSVWKWNYSDLVNSDPEMHAFISQAIGA